MSDHSNNEGPFDNNQNPHNQNPDGSQGNAGANSQQDSYYRQEEQYSSLQNNQQQSYTQDSGYHNQYQAQQQPNYSQGYQQGQYGQYPPPPPPGGYPYPPPGYGPKKTNTKSIIGLILGIASIVLPYIGFFFGIAGIIVNSLSLKEIKRTYEDGKGMAIGGLVTSIIGTALYALIFIFLIFVFAIAANANSYYY